MLQTSPVSGLYAESPTFLSEGGSDYFYTIDTFNTLYVDEFNYIDVSIVIDFFNDFTLDIYDIELFLAGEDFDGFTVFEYSSGVLLDVLSFDGDELIVEFEVIPDFDWPNTVYLFVTGEFSEDDGVTEYYTLDYTDDLWTEMGSVNIRERGTGTAQGFELFIVSIAVTTLVVLGKRK